jgi:acetylornithine deacetylase
MIRLPTLIECMHALIACPSVSSVSPHWDQGNFDVVDLLDQWFRTLGFETRVMPVKGHADKYNLVASAGRGPGGLVLSGHTDTVPYDEGKWRFDPFRVEERDGRLYGLGTCDMKGFFALVVEAVRDLDLATLKHPLTIVATADEESSMCGAKDLVDSRVRLGRHVVIGEPTGLRPVRMHKGIAMESIRIAGRSGHSSDPALGNNALEGMHQAIGAVLQWRQELQQKYRNPAFAVEVPTLNLGHIHGGDNPNRICAECELHFDIRPLPGMDLDALRTEIGVRLEQVLAGSGLGLEMIPLFEGIPPMETPAEAEVVIACEDLTRHPAEAVAFATEGPYFNALGMETVILGPGDVAQAHQPDEFVAVDRIGPGVEMLEGLIRRFCL